MSRCFYHIWAWRPPWSCDPTHLYEFSFTCTNKLSYEIWFQIAEYRVHTETVKQNSRTFQGHFVFFKDSFFIDSYSPNTVFLISPVVLQASGLVLSKILFFPLQSS